VSKVFIIVCTDKVGRIGKSSTNSLPWNVPLDLKYFKELTTNNIVIMGRNTYESIGKPLPNRDNYVISSTIKSINGANVRSSLMGTTIDLMRDQPDKDIFIIGGSNIYNSALPYVDGIYKTVLNCVSDGDIYFPNISYKFIMTSSRKEYCRDSKIVCNFETWSRG
jgi:dihydrofolate reductase